MIQSRCYLFLICFLPYFFVLLLSSGAYAGSVDEVVVSATGIPTKIDQIGSSISVLDEEDFLNYQERHLQNVLQYL